MLVLSWILSLSFSPALSFHLLPHPSSNTSPCPAIGPRPVSAFDTAEDPAAPSQPSCPLCHPPRGFVPAVAPVPASRVARSLHMV